MHFRISIFSRNDITISIKFLQYIYKEIVMFEYSHCMHICAYFCKNAYVYTCLLVFHDIITNIANFNISYQCEISNILRNSSQLDSFQ